MDAKPCLFGMLLDLGKSHHGVYDTLLCNPLRRFLCLLCPNMNQLEFLIKLQLSLKVIQYSPLSICPRTCNCVDCKPSHMKSMLSTSTNDADHIYQVPLQSVKNGGSSLLRKLCHTDLPTNQSKQQTKQTTACRPLHSKFKLHLSSISLRKATVTLMTKCIQYTVSCQVPCIRIVWSSGNRPVFLRSSGSSNPTTICFSLEQISLTKQS